MIEIKNLKKSFAGKDVLTGLNLKIAGKERIALVGQNGCGKTTLIRCLLGLYHFSGEINLMGHDLKNEREFVLGKIAFVPQSPPALKNTVAEIISLTTKLAHFSPESVERIAEELGLNLSTCLHTPFRNLSGGMKQKLLISLALARRPHLLIMDEPSANLDPKARSVFFRLLSELPEDTAMILTSHRVDELSGIVSRVIELDCGRITMDDVVESGSKEPLTGVKHCTLVLKKVPASVKKALLDWGMKPSPKNDLMWSGEISSADSFRFHANLTRWSGIIETVTLVNCEDKFSEQDCICV